MKKQWNEKQTWDWYERQPWIVGCNYVPSCSINTIETWQEEGFDTVFRVMEQELALAASIGMNSVRMALPWSVWLEQRDGFFERFNRFLNLLEKYAMTLMPVLFDDCGRGPVEFYSQKAVFGKQPTPVPGAHGGFAPRPYIDSANSTYSMVDDSTNWPVMEKFVKEIVGRYGQDARILAWDIWNEPGNSGSDGKGGVDKSIKPLKMVFDWVRDVMPAQPLTAGIWDYYIDRMENGRFKKPTAIEETALNLSDVISFHYYGNRANTQKIIESLKLWNRPLFITEWLHRPFGNTVAEMLPMYKNEHIGCYNWGLVNGKSQNHEPWDWIKTWDLDFSQWQHDLFYSDMSPYNETEVELFKTLTESKGGLNMGEENFTWQKPVVIHNLPLFEDAGLDARLLRPGRYGCQYSRMVVLEDGSWLAVYTVYDNNGYLADPKGGTVLAFSVSCDHGETWRQISVLRHPARDLDNGQMILDREGNILLCCRSVRWQESYQLPVYRSKDSGKTWEFYSIIDEHNGAPGCFGNPDKGLYEPHFYWLQGGRLSVMYANEKHVTEPPYYSQIISQKISDDNGRNWGEEIWVAWDSSNPQFRPGMPVWTRMKNGKYIVVYEVVKLVLTQLESADIYYKISEDGIHWDAGIGTKIPKQSGGPFIEQMSGGRLVVTSLSGEISYSDNSGGSWDTIRPKAFPKFLWPSLYVTDSEQLVLFNSCGRKDGGENIQMRVGKFLK
jgi:hypothetical protein